ncbi:PAX3- and PAX7-binding protein 1 isoform X2 [Lycorma delicatula]|uniref:PAX3- and PAX7-binding protein 1 isoform X2 n=1 Tax=Lycorma delicatula TaxID=130591 RepID=UPI003F513CB1
MVGFTRNNPATRILNGKEALSTVSNLSSEEEEEEESMPGIMRHKFSHPDHMKQLLKSGCIPDAAMIHAARKRRQEAREMGGDYISVNNDNDNKFDGGSKSRLIREDENDNSDDEGVRLKMSLNMTAADKEKRREAFDAAQDDETDDLDRGEDDEWEKQQIRKGVTGAQLVAVQQESLYYQQFIPQETVMGGSTAVGMAPVVPMGIHNVQQVDCTAVSVFPPLPTDNDTTGGDPPSVSKKLKDRLNDLKEVHRRHVLDYESMETELNELKKEKERLKTEAPTLGDRFRFYQDLRGYVTDLVECLDEKVVILLALEQRLNNLYSRRCTELTSRRRLDVKDQAEEMAPASAASSKNLKRDEERVRRAAEREGRRIRRIRMREQKGIQKHVDGFSSDDEITEMEASSFRSQRDLVEQDAKHVFEDALDEFSTIKGVLERFEDWRKIDLEAYSEAYVNLCLPKVLGPLIRLQLLMWNPLYQNNGSGGDLEKTVWCHNLLMYGIKQIAPTEEALRADPDLQLVPRVFEKNVVPKLNQLVEVSWDPVSTSQTLVLVQLVTHLIQQFPTLSNDSKNFTALLSTIVNRMRDAVENDVFIPIYPRHMMEGKINVFFQRQFASGVKLLSNLVRWQGILSDEVVFELALDSVLNRYLLSAARICDPLQGAAKCHMISSVLPKVWLQPGGYVPQQLVPLLNQAKLVAQQLDPMKPLHRDAIEKLNSLLRVAS